MHLFAQCHEDWVGVGSVAELVLRPTTIPNEKQENGRGRRVSHAHSSRAKLAGVKIQEKVFEVTIQFDRDWFA